MLRTLVSRRAALQAEDPRAAAAGGAQLVFQDSDRQGMFVFKGRQVGEAEVEGSGKGVLEFGCCGGCRGATSPLLVGCGRLTWRCMGARLPILLQYPVTVLNLPSVVESYKTLDDVNLVKTTDIGQV